VNKHQVGYQSVCNKHYTAEA